MDQEIRPQVIVTGVNGFVGEHLSKHLKESGFFTTGLGRENHPNEKVAPFLDTYARADLLDTASLEKISFKSASAIIHLAGLASVADSFKYPDLYTTGNAEMTDNLLSVATKQGFNGRTLVVSTGALYDPNQAMPLNEESATVENSPYATGKLRAEEVAKQYIETGNDVVVARPFNHIGPGQGTGFLIPDLYEQLKEASAHDESIINVGNLHTKRDYTDVRDIVKAYVKLATASHLSYDTYNIASGVSYSGLEMLEFIKEASGITNITPVVDQSRVRPTDAMDIIGDPTRLQEELGWKPESSPQTAIKDFVDKDNA